MDRAAGCDFQQPGSLGLIETSLQSYFALDFMQHSVCGFAILTVLGVNPPVTQPDLNAIQRQSFPLRIHAECDGRSRSERC